MNHFFIRLLADMALFILVIFIPALAVIYTDRFRHMMSPDQYATIFAAAAIAGVLLFIPAISIVAVTALLALGVAWLTAQRALSHLSYERTLEPARLFARDEAKLTLRLKNDKFLPLAWLTLTDTIHHGLVSGDRTLDDLLRFSGGIEILDTLEAALVNWAAIGPYQELARTYRLTAIQRGAYRLGPAEAVSGDPFGIFRRTMSLGGRTEILVYPKVYTPEQLGLPFRQAMGSLVARRTLYEDPTLLAGSREYRPGDSLRRMHWKATARTGELQVRVCDPSTTAQLLIVLNLNTFQHVWQGVDLERMEAVISAAASLAIWALERDFAVGLRSNGVISGSEGAGVAPRLPISAHPRQATMILEHLARLSFSGRFTPAEILVEEGRRLGAGRTAVFVTATLTPDVIGILSSRPFAGRSIVLYCGRWAAPVVRGLPVFLAAPAEEERRAVS